MISIKGLDKAAVLVALYNNSKPLGSGFLHYDPLPMTLEEAQDIIKNGSSEDYFGQIQTTKFDYLKGRVMKVDLSGVEFDEWGYDRDNGTGAALRALKQAGLI
jgi:hypothetical protein